LNTSEHICNGICLKSILVAISTQLLQKVHGNRFNPLTCILKHFDVSVMWKTIVQPPIDAVALIILVNLLAQDVSISLDFSLSKISLILTSS